MLIHGWLLLHVWPSVLPVGGAGGRVGPHHQPSGHGANRSPPPAGRAAACCFCSERQLRNRIRLARLRQFHHGPVLQDQIPAQPIHPLRRRHMGKHRRRALAIPSSSVCAFCGASAPVSSSSAGSRRFAAAASWLVITLPVLVDQHEFRRRAIAAGLPDRIGRALGHGHDQRARQLALHRRRLHRPQLPRRALHLASAKSPRLGSPVCTPIACISACGIRLVARR